VNLSGTIHKYGDHVDTDVILPGRYLTLRRPEDLARHCLEGLDPTFVDRVRPGDILVAGRNFGSGSSREHAPIAIKAVGIACVVAESFARIFFRNAINIGLPVLVSPQFAAAVRTGDVAEIDLAAGSLLAAGQRFTAQPLPAAVSGIIHAGGLVPFVRRRLGAEVA
jgi:3-isopropylmalate dehydratase small subunit